MHFQEDFLDTLDPKSANDGPADEALSRENEYAPEVVEPEIPKVRKLSDAKLRALLTAYLIRPGTKKYSKAETTAFFVLDKTKHTPDDLTRLIEILNEESSSNYYWQKED